MGSLFIVPGIVFAVALLVTSASAASRTEIINACHSSNSTVCIGYNTQDADTRSDCGVAPETCFFAFAAISKPPSGGDGYLVQLVGKGSGWVGLAFSDDERQVMRPDNLAVVCVNRANPQVRILRIQERDTSGAQKGPKIPFTFDDSGLSESVRNPSLSYSDGWLVCEFVLSSKPRHSERTLDLGGATYKLALAGHEQYGLDTAPGSNQPVYHQRRGSSAKKVDAFQRVNGAMAGARAIPASVLMGLSLVLVTAFSKHVL